MRRFALLVLAAIVVFSLVPLGARADERQALVDESRQTLERFLTDPATSHLALSLRRARGVLVVPRLIRGGLFVGAAGGTGVVLARDKDWSNPAFYTIGGLTLDFQLGAEVSEVILVMMTRRALDAVLATDAVLGQDVSVISESSAPRTIQATTDTDYVLFTRATGAYAGGPLDGVSIRVRPDWNRTYYGATLAPPPRDILIRRKVKAEGAQAIRDVLDKTRR